MKRFFGLGSMMENTVSIYHPSYGQRHRLSLISILSLLIAISFYLTALTNVANAATYYLDAVNGDDSNPGTQAEPWQNFGRAWPHYGGAGTKVVEGDTVWLAEGDYGDFDAGNQWYEGGGDTGRRNWIEYRGTSGSEPTIRYLMVKNVENAYIKFYNIKFSMPTSAVSNDRCCYLWGASNIVSYVEFYECIFDGTNQDASSGFCLTLYKYSNIVIDGCEFDSGGYGLDAVGYGSNLTVRNCYFHDQWQEVSHVRSQIEGHEANNILIEGCRFEDMKAIDGLTNMSSHGDYFQASGAYAINNLTLRGNTFKYAFQEGWETFYGQIIIQPVTASINFTFENNLMYGSAHGWGFGIMEAIDTVIIRNNTFAYTSDTNQNDQIGTNCTNVQNYNNIWRRTFVCYAPAAEVSQNNNIYGDYNNAMSKPPMGNNSIELGSANVEALFTDFDNDDFTLAAGSQAIGFGDATRAPAVDILGNIRDSSPDAGCYEYVSSGSTSSAPVLAAIGNKSVNENAVLTFTVSATDADGDTITYSAQNSPNGATFASQTFSWTPSYEQAGTYNVTFTASDGTASDSETIAITVNNVNRAPVLTAIGDKSVNENNALSFSISATDADGDTLTYTVQSLPTGAVFVSQTFTWTPSYSQAGNHQVSFTVSDGTTSDSETITITVNNVNRAPILAAIGNKSLFTEASLAFTVDATDPDGDTITYSAENLPSGAIFASRNFSWTPSDSQAGIYEITFIASDGQAQDYETITIAVTLDTFAPSVTNYSPATNTVQVPLNNLITLHIVDVGNKGVDANSVSIKVNDDVVYSGNVAHYSSVYGDCRRTGTKADYTFVYQSNNMFDFDQTMNITVNATDLGGNVMNAHSHSFKTEMRSFGQNKKLSTAANGRNKGQVVTVRDSGGNIWAAWHAGPVGSRDIYVAKLASGADSFGSGVRLTDDANDQYNPDIAVGSDDKLYVVWQDNRRENWDIYISTSVDGTKWSAERRVTDSNDNQANPVVVVDHSLPVKAYVAWQDDRNSNLDIFIASSSNGFLSRTISQITTNISDQFQPAAAVDADNVVYVVWTDSRNGSNDIYGAASNDGPWTNVAVVSKEDKQSNPAVATEAAGSNLHLLWIDDTTGDDDIFYAKTTGGLPDTPLTGSSIIDDTLGADQLEPVIAVAGSSMDNNLEVFACWQDERNLDSNSRDTDLYFVEISSSSRTNIFVGDDGTNANQWGPAIGIDEYGYPYLVWIDDRDVYGAICYAGSTFIESTPVKEVVVSMDLGATVGTDYKAISNIDDISVEVPQGAYPCDIRVTISRVKNPPESLVGYLTSPYECGPSGITFDVPVTVTIPYSASEPISKVWVYWYDPLTGMIKQDGITNVTKLEISSNIHAVRFKTTHFTQFIVGGSGGILSGGGGGGGGCSMSRNSQGSLVEFLLPYIGLAIVMVILKRRDARNQRECDITRSKC